MSRSHKFFLNETALIFISFFALRFLVMWTGIERISHNDELDLGTIAREIMLGLKVPYRDYQLDFYSGDSLVLGAAAVPFFKIFGMNLFALKMVPLLFSFLTLAASYFFLHRHFGEAAAKRGAWLLVLCPASFVQLSMVGLSGHSEGLLWSIASVWFFYEFLHGKPEKRGKNLMAFAVLSSFGTWFYYANIIMTISCLITWIALERKTFFSPLFFLFALGFTAGAVPWFFSNIQWVPGFFSSLMESPSGTMPNPALTFLKKEFKLFFIGLPHAFAFYPVFGVPARLLSFSFWALCFLPALIWGLKRTGDKKLMPLALYSLVFFAVFAFVHFDLQEDFGFVGYRYLTPLIYFSLLVIAVMSARGLKGKILWAAAIGLGVLTQAGLVFAGPGGHGLFYKGYSYYQLGIRWEFSMPVKAERLPDLALKFPEKERKFFLWGLGDAAVMEGREDVLKQAPAHLPFSTAEINGGKAYYMEWSEGKRNRPAGDSPWFWRGAGYLFFMRECAYPKRLISEFLASDFFSHAGKHRPEVFWGIGWAMHENFREDRHRALDWIKQLPPDARAVALEGAEYFEKVYGINGEI